jgi:hypothetical protein
VTACSPTGMLGRNMASEAAVRSPLRSSFPAFAENESARRGPAAGRSGRSWHLRDELSLACADQHPFEHLPKPGQRSCSTTSIPHSAYPQTRSAPTPCLLRLLTTEARSPLAPVAWLITEALPIAHRTHTPPRGFHPSGSQRLVRFTTGKLAITDRPISLRSPITLLN